MTFTPGPALSPEKEMFELAVEICPSGIVMVDGAGKMLMINNEMERLFGYRREELIGQTVDVLVPARLRTQHVRHLDDFKLRPEPRRMGAGRDLFGLRKDGSEFPIEIGLNPVKAGETFFVLSTIVDISARKRADDMLRLAFEACPSGMVMTDGTGNMVIINNEIERLFGYRREELIGQSVEILVPEGQRAQHVRHRRAFAARPEARRLGASRDLFGKRKDGSEFAVEIGLNPIRVGNELFILSAVVDISARRQRELLKDQFVSTVSHELRTPMTSISGALGLIVAGAAGKLPDSAARLVTVAQTNCQRLVRLINDILDIEKLHSGRVEFNLKRVELLPLIEQVIDSIRGFADGHGVRVEIDGSSATDTIHVDPDRFAQVMTNLLSNAIKFSPRDQEVIVAIEKRPRNVCITVRDYGPGIPDDFKPRIFEEFAQANTTNTREKGGTGLGLSIAREIVKRLGGQVGFHDAPGGGTVFYVELPSIDHSADGDANFDTEPEVAQL